MPSFKRREPAASANRVKPACGLRPAPYPSGVPLFSTGVASLDDVLTGSGLPSSSILLLCPALGLATITGQAEEPETERNVKLKPRDLASGSNQTLDALQAAENVALDLLSYGVAQGLVSRHETLVIGKDARRRLIERVPGRAVARDYNNGKDQTKEAEDLTIAFRYAHRPKFKTTVDEPEVATSIETPEEHLFRAPFDISKRWSVDEIMAAEKRERERIRCLETSNLDDTWKAIEEEAERCKSLQANLNAPSPALRIILPSLGAGMRAGCEIHLSRFLLRLRRLLKRISLDEKAPIPCICTITLSADVLAHSTYLKRTTLHLSRFVDSQLLISDFTSSPHLQKAYLGYGGSCFLLKGPSVGYLLPPGESRSVLRGGTAEAGAENDVGWKRRRRGIVLETLHEDVDASVKKKDDTVKVDDAKKKIQGDDIEEAALGLHRKEEAAPVTPPEKPTKVKFEGLKSLRERGLRVTKQVNVQVDAKDEQW